MPRRSARPTYKWALCALPHPRDQNCMHLRPDRKYRDPLLETCAKATQPAVQSNRIRAHGCYRHPLPLCWITGAATSMYRSRFIKGARRRCCHFKSSGQTPQRTLKARWSGFVRSMFTAAQAHYVTASTTIQPGQKRMFETGSTEIKRLVRGSGAFARERLVPFFQDNVMRQELMLLHLVLHRRPLCPRGKISGWKSWAAKRDRYHPLERGHQQVPASRSSVPARLSGGAAAARTRAAA